MWIMRLRISQSMRLRRICEEEARGKLEGDSSAVDRDDGFVLYMSDMLTVIFFFWRQVV